MNFPSSAAAFVCKTPVLTASLSCPRPHLHPRCSARPGAGPGPAAPCRPPEPRARVWGLNPKLCPCTALRGVHCTEPCRRWLQASSKGRGMKELLLFPAIPLLNKRHPASCWQPWALASATTAQFLSACIPQVTPGSKAAIANLCIGDQIIAIDGVNTDNMTHLEAQNKIKACTDELTLTVSRTEAKVWSPLVNEEGKTHPYKMNLASEPQQRPTQFPRVLSMTYQPAGLNSRLWPGGAMQAPIASVYDPLQSSEPRRRHSSASSPSQLRVGPEQLKHAAQVCPNSPVEVEVPGLKVLHVQFNSPLQLYSQSNIMDTLQGQISSVSPDFPSLDQHNQTPGNIAIDKQSEVYKMLQENQESNEPPRQSASFLVLQEILESEEKEGCL
ncbi:PREDICTED: PDZ and LIM domain protein 1 isoform X5 [Corvus brachyrhynchos]|uniref:PDZ and LIM domain protein 1 isoform X5 n=1 Tax=Corvus brachyrhynchos TaxID=85066 RepID=UPI0008163F8E|nr:PREDICTED: PDZ and LIM domain protein 1 isoform X5 [Corvus brachyrhynchos]